MPNQLDVQMSPTSSAWHELEVDQVLLNLDSHSQGLTTDQATGRLRSAQQLKRRAPKWLRELAESVTEPLQLLLIAVGVLSAIFGEVRDAVAIFVVIAAVVVVETLSEVRAERAVAGLRALTAPIARVYRDRRLVEIPTAQVVTGDVVRVEAGDLVPADARLITAHELRVNEATLTGEAAGVLKHAGRLTGEVALADRGNMVYAGTAVTSGEGTAVVTAAGADTELGRLGGLVASEREPATPLQKALGELARLVLVFAVGASVLVPLVGVLAGRGFKDMILEGLTVAFATVPEELPILITVLLAVGGQQLARRGALLRRLGAGEALGATTVVLTDKTGTLTQNHLRLDEIVGDERAVLATALRVQAPTAAGERSREPMEAALAQRAEELGVRIGGVNVANFPFDPESKLVTRVWQLESGYRVAVSGAPESVLARCDLDDTRRAQAEADVEGVTGLGLRMIAFAHRETTTAINDRDDAEENLCFDGFATFTDPLREGVSEAVHALDLASVQTIMVTGDHPTTAAAIAREAGLSAQPLLIGGEELARTSDAELTAQLRDGAVLARSTPQDKLRLVRLLQARGEVVAVTGDGANDAPALAAADIGIAMGRRGADLARDAADVVLTDDSYPVVVAAIAKGRNISAQLRRAVAFYLGAKVALVACLLIPLATGSQAPFGPVHIVVLELFMDLGASVAFIAEPAAPNAMRRPPRPPGARFLDGPAMSALAAVAVTLTIAVAPVYLVTLHSHGVEAARAAAILAWLGAHALIAWTLRTQPRLSFGANPGFPLWAATALVLGFLLGLTGLGGTLHLAVLSLGTLALTLLGVVVAVGLAVIARRRLNLPTRL